MRTMSGTIGHSSTDVWKPYTSVDREKHLDMVNSYLATLPKQLSASTLHSKKLSFMADNGIRQLGKPRIGIFADRVKPDPLHCEINAWQHILDLLYSESVQRNAFDKFVEVLSARIGASTRNPLNSIDFSESSSIDTHGVVVDREETVQCTDDSNVIEGNCQGKDDKKNSSLSPGMVRQFSFLEMNKKAAADSMTAMLETSDFTLSDNCAGVYGCGLSYLSTKVKEHYDDESKRFNKLSVRLIGAQAIALARHSYRLVDALQTTSETEGGKLRRLALGKIVEYLRNAGGLYNKVFVNSPGEICQLEEFCHLYFNLLVLFFPNSVNVTVWTMAYALPYHARQLYEMYGIGFGILSLQAKESKHAGLKGELSMTNRSHSTDKDGKWWQQCVVCGECSLVVNCAQEKKLLLDVVTILKPCVCNICNERFPDSAGLKVHKDNLHGTKPANSVTHKQAFKSLSVDNLKGLLREKGLSTSGRKEILLRRLEGAASGEF